MTRMFSISHKGGIFNQWVRVYLKAKATKYVKPVDIMKIMTGQKYV